MTAPKNPDATPGNPLAEKLPVSVRNMMRSTPQTDWKKIKAFVIGSVQEAELVEVLPEVNRVMRICPPKLMTMVMEQEITPEDYQQGFRRLRESIHGVRQACYALLHLAGYREYRMPKPKAKAGTPDADDAEAEQDAEANAESKAPGEASAPVSGRTATEVLTPKR